MQFDLAGISVLLAMPVHRDICPHTVMSLIRTQVAMGQHGIDFDISFLVGNSLVHHARSKAADDFVKSRHNRLFFVDSDIVWKPEDFVRLVALSTRMDIVVGVYTSKKEPSEFVLKADPSVQVESNEYGCVPVLAAGLGFACLSRKVIERLSSQAALRGFKNVPHKIPYLFYCDANGDDFSARGEDMAFFADARRNGFTVWADPSIELGHVGSKVYSGKLADALAPV